MEGQADTPMHPGGSQPPQPTSAPPPPPSRHTPHMAKALQAARRPSSPPGGGAEEPPGAPGAPPGHSPAPQLSRAASGPGRPHDPLSVPFQLPSGGLYYPQFGHQDTIYISPTRGAQEEVLAGIKGSSGARLKVLIHVTEQCFQVGAIPFDALLLDDWVAALLHFLSYSAGSEILALRPRHTACGSSFPATKKLSDLPLRILRLAEAGEEPNWPPKDEATEDLTEEMRILMEMEAEEKREELLKKGEEEEEDPRANIEEFILRPQDAQEPFTSYPLPNGDVVTWRLVRLVDLVKAEEFAERIGSTQTQPGTKLHTFLLARHILAINGDRMSPTRAYQWVKGQPSPILSALREQINARTCGYETAPRFRCRNCGGSFKVRLPLDGSLFRRPASTRR